MDHALLVITTLEEATREEVFDILRSKAGDPEGFVTEQVRRLEDGS